MTQAADCRQRPAKSTEGLTAGAACQSGTTKQCKAGFTGWNSHSKDVLT